MDRDELSKLLDINEYDPIEKDYAPGAYSTFEGSPASKGLL